MLFHNRVTAIFVLNRRKNFTRSAHRRPSTATQRIQKLLKEGATTALGGDDASYHGWCQLCREKPTSRSVVALSKEVGAWNSEPNNPTQALSEVVR